MDAPILLYVGFIHPFIWGIAHLLPTINFVSGFGDRSIENRRIIAIVRRRIAIVHKGKHFSNGSWISRVVSCLMVMILVLRFAPSAIAQSQQVNLRLNQVGYLPAEPKLAFALTNQNLSGQAFNAVTATGNSIVFSGTVGSDRGTYGNFAHLYELNFSGLAVGGAFRLRLGGDTSTTFTVGANAYAGILSTTLQFFRVQRCGNVKPLLHGACHITDGIVANGTLTGTHVNAAGGWHDAGDYLKFVTTSAFALTLMLHSYLQHPKVFADADSNGVPDVLDEARIGLDWLLKMWNPTGQVLYYQVGDYRDHQYGWRMPEVDDTTHPNRPVWACEAGKGANVAGKASAALALAAAIWNDPKHTFYDPTLALTYRAAAEQIYAYGKARPAAQSSTSDTTVTPIFIFYQETDWQDKMALAAAELYRVTGSQTYLNDARTYAVAWGSVTSFYYGAVGALAQYEIAHLDTSYLPTAKSFLLADLGAYQTRFSTSSFRVAESLFDWGSSQTIAGSALTALWYEDLTGDSTYHVMAQAQRDFLLGRNPWGISFVNSVGTIWPHHPHHQVADLTHSELVGFWDEGPAALAIVQAQGVTLGTTDAYAAFQTAAAVYHDDVRDYVTNEPIITMNATGLALTSWFAPVVATPVVDVERLTRLRPAAYRLHQNYPNPFNPSTTIRYELPSQAHVILKVFNLLGEEVATLIDEMKAPQFYTVAWTPTGIPSGVYFCRLQANSFVETIKLILIR